MALKPNDKEYNNVSDKDARVNIGVNVHFIEKSNRTYIHRDYNRIFFKADKISGEYLGEANTDAKTDQESIQLIAFEGNLCLMSEISAQISALQSAYKRLQKDNAEISKILNSKNQSKLDL